MEIDIRGPRFGAVITFIVLALAFATGSPWILAVQNFSFALGAYRGPHRSPYGLFFGRFIKPRISPTRETEDSRAPQFAQAVGLVFGLVGLTGALLGLAPVFYIATGFALAAAFLNAAFSLCLGCEMYLLIKRFSPKNKLVEAQVSRETSLVTSEWLTANLENPEVVLIEVDEDTDAYDQGHIAGAIKFHWRNDLQESVRRDIISKQGFEALLSRFGVANDHTVVLYGGNNNWFAAYAYWYFKLYGHQEVKLLDGGRKIWELESRPMTAALPSRKPTTYVASDQNHAIRAFRDEVLAAIGSKNLVDVRSPAEFSGELAAPAHLPQEQGQVRGHIPTAKNIPWAKSANEDGTFKSDEDLAQLYKSAGLDSSKDTIAYCRIGERSSHSWFVLHELLGLKNVKNYDGSWTEYGSLVGVPVELGV